MSQSNHGSQAGSQQKKKKKSGGMQWLFLAILAAGGATLIWFAAMNIAPYKALMEGSVSGFTKNGLVQFIYWLPIIGGIVKSAGNSIIWFAAFLVWLLIQLIEVLPGVLWRHGGFLQSVVSAHDQNSYVAVKDQDPLTIKHAKRSLNNLIGGFLENMYLYCIVAYLIDAAICCWYYPIMPGISWQKTVQYLMIGQFKYVNTGNVFGVISTLFAVEVIVHVLISVYMLSVFMKRSR
jgi:hypothetical protein